MLDRVRLRGAHGVHQDAGRVEQPHRSSVVRQWRAVAGEHDGYRSAGWQQDAATRVGGVVLVDDAPSMQVHGAERRGSGSKVEIATPMDLIYKVSYPSLSTFETPPHQPGPPVRCRRTAAALCQQNWNSAVAASIWNSSPHRRVNAVRSAAVLWRSAPPRWAWATNSPRVSAETLRQPSISIPPSTKASGERGAPRAMRRWIMSCTPGRSVRPRYSAAKLMRSTRVPLSIHSCPVCHPSTVGGFIRSMPMYLGSSEMANRPGLTSPQCSPVMRRILTTSSAGLLTLAKRTDGALKNSEVNSARSMAVRSYPVSKYVCSRRARAAGSFGGVCRQEGTGTSSATKKSYRCRARKRAVAACSQMMVTMSSPFQRPVRPRKVFSLSSWSAGS